VSRAVIDEQQITDMTSALMNVSGIQAGTSAGNRSDSFTIRAFRSSYYAVDSVMLSPAVETNDSYRDLANIERIEVLKGPASVLYGRGDPGGLINMVTKKPKLVAEQNYTVQTGSDDFWRGELDFTGPLLADQGLAYRLIGAIQRSDTFRDTQVPFNRQFLAPSISWQPTDRTRALASLTWLRQTSPVDRGIVATPDAAGNLEVSLPRDRFLGEKFADFESQRYEFNYRVEHDLTNWLTVRHVGHYDQGELSLFGINYTRINVDETTGARTVSRTAVQQDEENHSYNFQLDAVARFATGSIDHTVVAGLEYSESYRLRTFANSPLAAIDIDNPIYGARPTGFVLRPDREVNAKSPAFYLQDQIDIGERLNLLVGVRYDHAQQSDAGVTAYESDEKAWSPRVGLVFKPIPNVSLFADYTKSFQAKPEPTLTGAPIPAETGEQYEVGVKAELFDGRLSLTSAAYQLTRAHVAQQDVNNPGFNLDAGEQRARGVELDVAGQITDSLRVIGNVAYTDSEVLSSTDFEVGARLGNVPLWSGSLWGAWEPQAGALQGFGVGAGVYLASDRYGDLTNSFSIGGYERFDASVWYRVSDKARVTLSIKNIADDDYIDSSVSRYQISPAAGRTFLIGLSGQF
jgi:iron complex outermembrane receptor protein